MTATLSLQCLTLAKHIDIEYVLCSLKRGAGIRNNPNSSKDKRPYLLTRATNFQSKSHFPFSYFVGVYSFSSKERIPQRPTPPAPAQTL